MYPSRRSFSSRRSFTKKHTPKERLSAIRKIIKQLEKDILNIELAKMRLLNIKRWKSTTRTKQLQSMNQTLQFLKDKEKLLKEKLEEKVQIEKELRGKTDEN